MVIALQSFQLYNKYLLAVWIKKKELPDKGEIKADGELEIKLNCGTLMVPTDGVFDLNVDLHTKETWSAAALLLFHSLTASLVRRTAHLWSVESAVTWVQNPFLTKLVQAVLQLLLKQQQQKTIKAFVAICAADQQVNSGAEQSCIFRPDIFFIWN